jgi:hypothetical protein
MSDPLEKFVQENRQKFDSEAPDKQVWEKIREKMDPESRKQTPVRSLPFKRWMAAAAAVVTIGISGILYFSLKHESPEKNTVAQTKPKPADTVTAQKQLVNIPDSSTLAVKKAGPVSPKKDEGEKSQTGTDETASMESQGSKEMYYYAKLIELKHEELKTLEKDEPLLYRQFSGDVQKLDSVYHALKTQLPTNSNREQLIEAMISNLQLQIGLLNRQLDIIKQIKHTKKTAYEQAYKSL